MQQTLISPQALPTARATSLRPLFVRLLELRSDQLSEQLSDQCQEAITSLPEEDRPQSYEGLLDVARYCVDEEPGWSVDDKAQLLGEHPRIGAQKGTMSAASEKEQQATTADEASDKELRRLNFIYERRFPPLRYTTYVAGRPRSAIVSELTSMLGEEVSSLRPPSADSSEEVDYESPSAELTRWGQENIVEIKKDDEQWLAELERGLDALFEIAMDRASKITEADYTAPPRTTPFIDENEAFDEPFLTLERFNELVKASPLLRTFFEVDLPSSFYLVPPPPPQETAREALATLAAVAVTGGGGGDATRKRVRGLLGGLWGDLTDRAGKVTGRETRSGPRPAFGREEMLRGEEMRAKGAKETADDTGAGAAGGAGQSAGGTSAGDLTDAEESLKLATQRLTDVERGHFVIDEPTTSGVEGDEEDEDEDEGMTVGAGDSTLELGMDRLGIEDGEQVQARGKDKEIAKDLRTATSQ